MTACLPAWVPGWAPTVALLVASNSFMTFAWYYHVKQKTWPLVTAILVSWLIALPEYVLAVPANRFGHESRGGPFTLSQLKVVQEAVTLIVFAAFAILVAREKPRWNGYVAFLLIFAAVAVAMMGRRT